MKDVKEYYAFISYKREDEKWAKWLQKKLEHYKLPLHVDGRTDLPKEIRPVFKDTSELVPGNLLNQIQEALSRSKYLIVICSPRSASSVWVNQELETFMALGGSDNIIPFIIEGTPFSPSAEEECFPPALKSLCGEKEILGANVREMGRDAAAVKIVAKMFGLRFDSLWRRHERDRKRKRLFAAGIILAAVLAAVMILIYILGQNAKLKEARWNDLRKESLAMAEKAERLIEQGDSYQAAKIALAALPGDLNNPDRPYTLEAESALRKAVATGGVLIHETSGIEDMAFSPDGTILAVGSWDEDDPLKLWDVSSGQLLETLWPGEEHINAIQFGRDGKSLFTGASYLAVWDLNQKEYPVSHIPIDWGVTDIAVSPDGKTVIVIDYPNPAKVIDVDTGQTIGTLNHKDVKEVDASQNGTILVTKSDDVIKIWDTADWRRITEISSMPSCVFALDPTGEKMAIGTDNDSVRVIDVRSGQEADQLYLYGAPTGTGSVSSLAFSPDGRSIVACMGERIVTFGLDGTVSYLPVLLVPSPASLVLSPDGRQVAYCADSNTVRILTLETDQIEMTCGQMKYDPSAPIRSLAFGEKGERIVSCGYDGSVCLRDAVSGKEIWSFQLPDVQAVSFSPDGSRYVAVFAEDAENDAADHVCILDSETGQELWTYKDSFSPPRCAVFSPDGERIAIGDYDGVTLVDVSTGEDENFLLSDRGWYIVNSLAFSPDGQFLASDGIIWNVSTQEAVWELPGGYVSSVAFSPDGKRIVTGDRNGSVTVWDMETGREIVTMHRHCGEIRAITFSPDGNRILSISSDKQIYQWPYPTLRDLMDAVRE